MPVVSGITVRIDGTPTMLVDLSPTGAQIISPLALRPQKRIRLTLPKEDGLAKVAGTVVWCAFELPRSGTLPTFYDKNRLDEVVQATADEEPITLRMVATPHYRTGIAFTSPTPPCSPDSALASSKSSTIFLAPERSPHGPRAMSRMFCMGLARPLAVLTLAWCGLSPPTWAEAASGIVPDDFPTIQRALDQARPGDLIQVRDTAGPFFEKIFFPRSGNRNKGFITLTAFPGHAPILDGTGVSGSDMVRINSKSYIRLIGFEIRNNLGVNDGSGVRIVGAGSHIEIRDNRIHDMRGRDAMGITVYGTSRTASIREIGHRRQRDFRCRAGSQRSVDLERQRGAIRRHQQHRS